MPNKPTLHTNTAIYYKDNSGAIKPDNTHTMASTFNPWDQTYTCPHCGQQYAPHTYHYCTTNPYTTQTSFPDPQIINLLSLIQAQLLTITQRLTKIEEILDAEL